MGSGARHGRGGARHHRRAHRPNAHHQATCRGHNRNRHRAHHHHHNPPRFFMAGAAGRRRRARAVNCSSANASETVINVYANTGEPVRSATEQCFAMSRVFSIFLWFAGIMMMSLGGFRTPVGFVGVACLVIGISILILTSMITSGSCSRNRNVGSDERQRGSYPPDTGNNRRSGFVPRDPTGGLPSSTADRSPFYTSTAPQTADKPPSYEEVTGAIYAPTISGSILSATISDPAQPLPYHGLNGPTGLPYPISPAAGPYPPPTDRQDHPTQSTQLPYPSYPTDGPLMPPPYSTSGGAGLLHYTASVAGNQSQAPEVPTPPPSPSQLGSVVIDHAVLYPGPSQPPDNPEYPAENFRSDTTNVPRAQIFRDETQPPDFAIRNIESVNGDQIDPIQPRLGTEQPRETGPASSTNSAPFQLETPGEAPPAELSTGASVTPPETHQLPSTNGREPFRPSEHEPSTNNPGGITPTAGGSGVDQEVSRETERNSGRNSDNTVSRTAAAILPGRPTLDIDVTEDISHC